MVKQIKPKKNKVSFKVSLEERPDFKGKVSIFVFDVAGNLLELAKVEKGMVSLPFSEEDISHYLIYLSPVPEDLGEGKPTIRMMERLSAYELLVKVAGNLVDVIRVPGSVIDGWHFCGCWVRGRVIKSDSENPVCGAKVHICEVDKLWRLIVKLPELEVLRFRDDLLEAIEKPRIPWPPIPGPDPPPFSMLRSGLLREREFDIQPELFKKGGTRIIASSLSKDIKEALMSTSPAIVRNALIENISLIIPYLCIMPTWLRFRCDEITVVETDTFGRFQAILLYTCGGDKPDIYFWVEYEIDGTLETVYRPWMACNTYWDYACGTEVLIRITDERVPACDHEPDLPGCTVQILSVGRNVSISEIQGYGATVVNEGLTSDDCPFGGKLEPRVWFSRTALRTGKNIKYYRWSYRRLTQGDGTPLITSDPWKPLTRTVVRHYAKPAVPSGVTHEPYILGPKTTGAETNLVEIKPAAVPSGGTEWTIVDEREDLASAHFETTKLGSDASPCEKAFNAAGKYELKLELFKDTGALVDWTTEGIDLQITDVPAPFSIGVVTSVVALDYNRIKNPITGNTVAFRMVLRIDNNCCEAKVEPVTGTGPCGFIEFIPGASVNLHFKARHPNNFADFNFSVKRGVSTHVVKASTSSHRVGSVSVLSVDTTHTYVLTVPNDYKESFTVADLLARMQDTSGVQIGPCERAAFSEALYVRTRATDGYTRLGYLDAFDHDGFALTPSP